MRIKFIADRWLKNDSEYAYLLASYKDLEKFKNKFIELGFDVTEEDVVHGPGSAPHILNYVGDEND